MKKFSLFLSAMLISMMSFAAEQTATISFADVAQRTVLTTEQQVWEQNGLVVTNDKAASTNNVADYSNPARFYKSSALTIKCTLGNITKIVVNCNNYKASYSTDLVTSVGAEAVADGTAVTITPTEESDTYSIASLAGQVRVNDITVTYEAASNPDAVKYTVTANVNDPAMGTVSGAGEYEEGKTATLTAHANAGYEFVNWSNGSTDNPLKFEVTENVELTANFQAQTPITIAEALVLADGAACVLNPVTVVYVSGSYIYIEDESAYALAYKYNYGLVAGDKVTGLAITKSTYNGIAQFTPASAYADLTIAAGEAPAIDELTSAPTVADNHLVKLMNVKMEGEFTTSTSGTLVATCADETTINIYNNKVNAYTFVADKTYNIIGGVTQYKNVIQIQAYEIEEYVAPATETVYFVNAQNWGAVNAYVWDAEGNNGGAWPGAAATKEAEQIGGYDVYSYTAEAGAFVNVIFNDGSSTKTSDLVWEADKYYVIDGWYTKEEAEAKLAAPVADIWTVAGAPASIFGTEWDPANAANNMALQEDGTYKWEKADLILAASNIQFKVAKNNSWGEAYPADNYNLAIAEAGIYTITITFNAETKEVAGTATKTGSAVVIPTIAIAGDMNGWNTTANEFVVADDELTASLTLPLEAKDYGFKMIIAGGWTSDGATVTRENNTVVFTGANGDNSTLTADVAGDYTFTWTYATSTLVVTYPVASSVDNVQVNATAVKVIKNGQLIIIKNGKEYNVQGAILK